MTLTPNKPTSTQLARMLLRLAEKTRRANAIQHSGSRVRAEDWSELNDLTNEALALLAAWEASQPVGRE